MECFFMALCLIVSCILSYILIPKILLLSIKKKLFDIPNERKVHKINSSRLGGTVFFPVIMSSLCILIVTMILLDSNALEQIAFVWLIMITSSCFIVYIVGFIDDISELKYRIKLIFQMVATLFVVFSGYWIDNLYGIFGVYELPEWLGMTITFMFVLFIINAMNLIDGIDGLSSGLSIIILCVYMCLFCYNHMYLPASISAAYIGSLIIFFKYNVFGILDKKTKIFMGDSGALLVGNIIAILAIRLVSSQSFGIENISTSIIVIAYSVLIVPTFDVVRVIISRLLKKKSPFLPDKNHIHHKLIGLGYSDRQTLIILLSSSVLQTFFNLALSIIIRFEIIVIVNIICYTLINIFITKKIRVRQG